LGKAQNEDSTDSSARRKLPTKLYGGTERLVSYLTEELVRLGHDVTLFACGDSITASNLVPCANTALRLDPNVRDMTPYYVMMLDEVYRRLDDFDVLHFHIDHLHYPMMRAFSDRMLTTLHGRLDLPDLTPFYSRFPELPLVSIPEAQRLPMPPVNWVSTIYHGCQKPCCPSRNGRIRAISLFSVASRRRKVPIGQSKLPHELAIR
jgi:glycosyltransferase involved in cell wall biosynthesis